MFALQCMLIAFLCSISGNPFPGMQLGGWYTLGRPLIGGAICGIILGDVQTGIELGIAIQLVYLALVTPGGSLSTDVSFVAYPAMAIAILADLDSGSAIALAAAIGVISTFITNLDLSLLSLISPYVNKALEENDYKAFKFRFLVVPQALLMISRFIPAFVAVYFGAQYVTDFMNMLPAFVMDAMNALGGVLPAVGIATLLATSVYNKAFIIFFLVGFVGIVFMNLNIIALTIIAAAIAYLYFMIRSQVIVNSNAISDDEEVL